MGDPVYCSSAVPEFGSQTFAYDELDRLLTDTGTGTDYPFAYDDNGNRLTAQMNSTQVVYNYDLNSNRMNALDGTSVVLDASGNTLIQGNLDTVLLRFQCLSGKGRRKGDCHCILQIRIENYANVCPSGDTESLRQYAGC